MNPYLITGPAQIGISGGRTSGHMAYKILEAHGGVLPPDVHIFFQNTGKEREETLVFIDQIAKRWNVNIVWMEWCRVYGQPDDTPWYKLVDFDTASRNGEPFTMMLEYYAAYRKAEKNLPPVLPNFSNNMCTAYLKVKIGEKHMRAQGYAEWDCVVGIRYDEPKRYQRMMAANERGGNPPPAAPAWTPRDYYANDVVWDAVYKKAAQELKDAMDLAYLTGQRPVDVLVMRKDDVEGEYLGVQQNKTHKKLRIQMTAGGETNSLGRLIAEISTRNAQHVSNYLIVSRHGKRIPRRC